MLTRRNAAALFVFIAAFSATTLITGAEQMQADKMCTPENDYYKYRADKPRNAKFTEKVGGVNKEFFNMLGFPCKDVTAGKTTSGVCVASSKCMALTTDGQVPDQEKKGEFCSKNPEICAGIGTGGSAGAPATEPPSGSIPQTPIPDSGSTEPKPTEQFPPFDDCGSACPSQTEITPEPNAGAENPWIKNPQSGEAATNDPNSITNSFEAQIKTAEQSPGWLQSAYDSVFKPTDAIGGSTGGIGNNWGGTSLNPDTSGANAGNGLDGGASGQSLYEMATNPINSDVKGFTTGESAQTGTSEAPGWLDGAVNGWNSFKEGVAAGVDAFTAPADWQKVANAVTDIGKDVASSVDKAIDNWFSPNDQTDPYSSDAIISNAQGSIGAESSQQQTSDTPKVLRDVDAKTTFYGPGAGGKVQGGYETSRPNLNGENVPMTLDDVRQGNAQAVTLASNQKNYGQFMDMGPVTYKSPIDGVTYTGDPEVAARTGATYSENLKDVVGYVHDTGSAFNSSGCANYGTCGVMDRKYDVAVGDFRGWSGNEAMRFLTSNGQAYGGNVDHAWQQISSPSEGSSQFAGNTAPSSVQFASGPADYSAPALSGTALQNVESYFSQTPSGNNFMAPAESSFINSAQSGSMPFLDANPSSGLTGGFGTDSNFFSLSNAAPLPLEWNPQVSSGVPSSFYSDSVPADLSYGGATADNVFNANPASYAFEWNPTPGSTPESVALSGEGGSFSTDGNIPDTTPLSGEGGSYVLNDSPTDVSGAWDQDIGADVQSRLDSLIAREPEPNSGGIGSDAARAPNSTGDQQNQDFGAEVQTRLDSLSPSDPGMTAALDAQNTAEQNALDDQRLDSLLDEYASSQTDPRPEVNNEWQFPEALTPSQDVANLTNYMVGTAPNEGIALSGEGGPYSLDGNIPETTPLSGEGGSYELGDSPIDVAGAGGQDFAAEVQTRLDSLSPSDPGMTAALDAQNIAEQNAIEDRKLETLLNEYAASQEKPRTAANNNWQFPEALNPAQEVAQLTDFLAEKGIREAVGPIAELPSGEEVTRQIEQSIDRQITDATGGARDVPSAAEISEQIRQANIADGKHTFSNAGDIRSQFLVNPVTAALIPDSMKEKMAEAAETGADTVTFEKAELDKMRWDLMSGGQRTQLEHLLAQGGYKPPDGTDSNRPTGAEDVSMLQQLAEERRRIDAGEEMSPLRQVVAEYNRVNPEPSQPLRLAEDSAPVPSDRTTRGLSDPPPAQTDQSSPSPEKPFGDAVPVPRARPAEAPARETSAPAPEKPFGDAIPLPKPRPQEAPQIKSGPQIEQPQPQTPQPQSPRPQTPQPQWQPQAPAPRMAQMPPLPPLPPMPQMPPPNPVQPRPNWTTPVQRALGPDAGKKFDRDYYCDSALGLYVVKAGTPFPHECVNRAQDNPVPTPNQNKGESLNPVQVVERLRLISGRNSDTFETAVHTVCNIELSTCLSFTGIGDQRTIGGNVETRLAKDAVFQGKTIPNLGYYFSTHNHPAKVFEGGGARTFPPDVVARFTNPDALLTGPAVGDAQAYIERNELNANGLSHVLVVPMVVEAGGIWVSSQSVHLSEQKSDSERNALLMSARTELALASQEGTTAQISESIAGYQSVMLKEFGVRTEFLSHGATAAQIAAAGRRVLGR